LVACGESIFPQPVKEIIRTFVRPGISLHLVGGAVRDLALGKTPRDFDFITDAPSSIISALPTAVEVNKKGTYQIKIAGVEIEITSFRIKGRASAAEDLLDRDITINSLAREINLSADSREIIVGDILDPVGGLADLTQGMIRFSDQGEITPERMIRACRIAANLGFEIEKATGQKIIDKVIAITAGTTERLREEFTKILISDNVDYGLTILQETGILAQMLKFAGITDAHTPDLLRIAQAPQELRLVVLLHELGLSFDEAQIFTKKFKYSNDETLRTQKLLGALQAAIGQYEALQQTENGSRAIRSILSKLAGRKERKGEYFEDYINLLKVCLNIPQTLEVKVRQEMRAPLTKDDLAINGGDLSALGMGQAEIGATLNYLLPLVIADPSKNERELLLEAGSLFQNREGN
jgi:tRNA nucleotidyltransferase (CCA-adding enzyme)